VRSWGGGRGREQKDTDSLVAPAAGSCSASLAGQNSSCTPSHSRPWRLAAPSTQSKNHRCPNSSPATGNHGHPSTKRLLVAAAGQFLCRSGSFPLSTDAVRLAWAIPSQLLVLRLLPLWWPRTAFKADRPRVGMPSYRDLARGRGKRRNLADIGCRREKVGQISPFKGGVQPSLHR